jgi:glycosyltransferase involved in cell wall biosynthesis
MGGAAHRWAQGHGCCAGVSFLGRLPHEQMLELCHRSVDTIVVPSLDESFSMVALEGMALGKPVIAGSRTPGVRDVLDRGQAGLLVDVRRPQAIAGAMMRLQTDPALFAELASAAYRRAGSVYSADRVVAHYEASYAAIDVSARRRGTQPAPGEATT